MPFFEREGIRFAYDEFGPSGAPVVVFSHGFLMDGDMFQPNIEELQKEFRCVVWDQRGFGATGATTRAFSYWDSAQDLIALLDHLEVASASLVGMSQGGFLSMRAALLEPDRFRAIALISTRSDIDSEEVRQSFETLKAEWARNGAKNVAQNLSAFLFGPEYAASALDPEMDERWCRSLRTSDQCPCPRDDVPHHASTRLRIHRSYFMDATTPPSVLTARRRSPPGCRTAKILFWSTGRDIRRI